MFLTMTIIGAALLLAGGIGLQFTRHGTSGLALAAIGLGLLIVESVLSGEHYGWVLFETAAMTFYAVSFAWQVRAERREETSA